MSKAAEKRAQDEFNRALRTMNSKTIMLRERFYESYVQFHTSQLENRLEILQEKLENATELNQKAGLPQQIKYVQTQLDKKFTNQLVWIQEAKDNFDAKITNVSRKLVEFGLTKGFLTIEDTWIESAQEMSFLITGEIVHWKQENEFLGTAHARLIWVNCYEKASHWRFICTLRDKPGTVNNPTQEKVEVKPTPRQAAGRLEQVKALRESNPTMGATQIANTLEMNVGYVRTLLRKLR